MTATWPGNPGPPPEPVAPNAGRPFAKGRLGLAEQERQGSATENVVLDATATGILVVACVETAREAALIADYWNGLYQLRRLGPELRDAARATLELLAQRGPRDGSAPLDDVRRLRDLAGAYANACQLRDNAREGLQR